MKMFSVTTCCCFLLFALSLFAGISTCHASLSARPSQSSSSTLMPQMMSSSPITSYQLHRTATLHKKEHLSDDELESSSAVVVGDHREHDEHDDDDDDDLVVDESFRGGAAETSPLMAELLNRLLIGFYFGLWYALNIAYNIVNKKVLNVWAAPMTVGSIQLGVGAAYVGVLWLLQLRPRPVLTNQGRIATRQVGLFHSVGQLATMVSLGAGPVSFTHIVKALEPFFSAIVSAVVFGQVMRPAVYATLIPVVGGVGYACLKERSFSWLAFGSAMVSNLAFSLRAVLSKVAMSSGSTTATTTKKRNNQQPNNNNPIGTHLTAANVFGLVTLSAFVLSIPMALIGEGQAAKELFSKALELQNKMDLIKSVILSGLFHYLNNEVMFLALGKVHPITLAVGNTMKRVFIMVASVIVFRNQITVQAGIGSAIGILGVLLYSVTKQYYEKLDAAASDKKKSKRLVAR